MKHNRKAAAPIALRASFQNPLSFPGIRFVGDGGDGSAVGDGGAPAGDGQDGEEQGGQNAPSNTPAPSNDEGEQGEEQGEKNGSQADDPKLKAARDEAAQNRIKAREAVQEKSDLIQTLGKALGLVKDEADAEPDAEAIIAAANSGKVEAQRELAVYKAAAANGADPSKLLDSRSFLASIKDVDHGDEKALGTAIKAAVDGNRSFASARAAGASTADTASGPGGGSTPKAEVSLEDALAGHYNR